MPLQLVTDQGVLRLNPGTVRVLGSHHDCDLHVPRESIAPLHLRLELTDDGHLFAEDLSSGRTQLNGQPLRGRAALSAGDELLVGGIAMRVESSASTEKDAGRGDTAISKPGVSSLPGTASLAPGTVVSDRYRIVQKLAAGGMGEVYRAEHIELGRPFALKVMKAELSSSPDFAERFRREAVASSRIGHPNIIDITDFGRTADGAFYFAMELLNGQTLHDMINAEGPLPLRRVRHLVTQLCGGLSAAHALGIVHRDLKPENVMVLQRPGAPDHVKILDFGIAKVSSGLAQGGQTALGMIVGTPQYMSPEQAAGLPGVDLRTDIYSLGLIIFEMLTGRPCFTGATPSLLIAKQVAEPPPPMTPTREPLPHTLRSGVMRMLAKKPDDRPQSMDEVLKIIGQDAALAHAAPTERATPAPAAPPPGTLIAPVAEPTKPETNRGTANMRPDPLMRLPPPRSKAPLLIGMGLVTFALVVGAVISLRKPPPAAPADTPVEATPPAAPVEPPPAPPPAPAPTVAKPAPEPVAAPVPPPAKKKPFAKKTTGPSTLKDVYSDDPPLKEIP